MRESLLDTDILNEVLKQRNSDVLRHAAHYLVEFGQFSLSAITRYEILRGLTEKQAATQIARFNAFCQHSDVLPVTNEVLDLAAELWAAGRAGGLTPNDADLIIAATALGRGIVLTTGNLAHFQWIPSLVVQNWRDATL
jgi:tRNA(fMet)-specific endonuclease VapC